MDCCPVRYPQSPVWSPVETGAHLDHAPFGTPAPSASRGQPSSFPPWIGLLLPEADSSSAPAWLYPLCQEPRGIDRDLAKTPGKGTAPQRALCAAFLSIAGHIRCCLLLETRAIAGQILNEKQSKVKGNRSPELNRGFSKTFALHVVSVSLTLSDLAKAENQSIALSTDIISQRLGTHRPL